MTDRPQPELLDHDEQVTAVVKGVVRMDELRDFFDRSFGALAQVLAAQDVVPRSAAFALYHGAPTDQVDLEVGVGTVEVSRG